MKEIPACDSGDENIRLRAEGMASEIYCKRGRKQNSPATVHWLSCGFSQCKTLQQQNEYSEANHSCGTKIKVEEQCGSLSVRENCVYCVYVQLVV